MALNLEQTINSIASKMRIDFEITKPIEHKGLKGRAREVSIKRRFLKKYLPSGLGVESGEIISSSGDVSKQIDLVIFDKFKCPILLREDEVHVFLIESVYAVIEVKSFLNSIELEKCIENIYSVKKIPKQAYIKRKDAIRHTTNLYGKEYECFPVIGLVFAFDSIENLDTLRQKLVKINTDKNIELESRIDTICILNKGVITNQTKNEMINLTPDPESKLVCIETDNSLLFFYLLLMSILNQTWMPPIQLTQYAKNVKFGKMF